MEEELSPIQTFILPEPVAGPSGGTSPDSYLRAKDSLATQALTVSSTLPDELRGIFQQLKLNIASAVHVKGAFLPEESNCTPSGFLDEACDPVGWVPANVATTLARALEIFPCAYHCENAGKLFVHLVPVEGDAKNAVKSRKMMRGHTDGVALPFPEESCGYSDIAPSPDLVILVGLRNLDAVTTNLAPLSVIMKKLSAETIRVLQEPIFDIRPQTSFQMSANFELSGKPIILRTSNDGYLIRFSHSNVVAMEGGLAANSAIDLLKRAIAESFVGVVVGPGDILFVNNRTALHGRSEIPRNARAKRWLLRTYGMYSDYSKLAVPGGDEFCLLPEKNGPTAIIAA